MESGTVEIRYSHKAMIGWIMVTLVFTAVFGLMMREGWTGSGHGRYAVRPGSFREFMAYAGFFLFGLCSIALFWRLVTTKGPVLTLSPSGITDIRIAKEEIPWSGIQSITMKTANRQQFCDYISIPPSRHA
jgi:hypothetical protein